MSKKTELQDKITCMTAVQKIFRRYLGDSGNNHENFDIAGFLGEIEAAVTESRIKGNYENEGRYYNECLSLISKARAIAYIMRGKVSDISDFNDFQYEDYEARLETEINNAKKALSEAEDAEEGEASAGNNGESREAIIDRTEDVLKAVRIQIAKNKLLKGITEDSYRDIKKLIQGLNGDASESEGCYNDCAQLFSAVYLLDSIAKTDNVYGTYFDLLEQKKEQAANCCSPAI